MEKSQHAVGRLARKLRKCLAQEGIDADIQVSEHEATVAARAEFEGRFLRVVAHVSDREPMPPSGHGSLPADEARARLQAAAVRPSLEQRAASRPNPDA
jgi:hypothetical protein